MSIQVEAAGNFLVLLITQVVTESVARLDMPVQAMHKKLDTLALCAFCASHNGFVLRREDGA